MCLYVYSYHICLIFLSPSFPKCSFYSNTFTLSRNFRTIKFNSFAHLKMKLLLSSHFTVHTPPPSSPLTFIPFSFQPVLISINMTITKDFHLSLLSKIFFLLETDYFKEKQWQKGKAFQFFEFAMFHMGIR